MEVPARFARTWMENIFRCQTTGLGRQHRRSIPAAEDAPVHISMMNSPIQGTAADIIKIAMNRVHDRLREEKMKSRLILQVHDELLVEAKLSEADRVEEILREEMQQAASLRVPLEIDLHRGKNWYEAK